MEVLKSNKCVVEKKEVAKEEQVTIDFAFATVVTTKELKKR